MLTLKQTHREKGSVIKTKTEKVQIYLFILFHLFVLLFEPHLFEFPFIYFTFWAQFIWAFADQNWKTGKEEEEKYLFNFFETTFFSNLFQKQKKVKILRLSKCSFSNNVFLQIYIFWSEHDPVTLIKSWCFWWCSTEQFVKQKTRKVKFAKC